MNSFLMQIFTVFSLFTFVCVCVCVRAKFKVLWYVEITVGSNCLITQRQGCAAS